MQMFLRSRESSLGVHSQLWFCWSKGRIGAPDIMNDEVAKKSLLVRTVWSYVFFVLRAYLV